MNKDALLLLLSPIILTLPIIIAGFVSKWRDDQADKEEASQNQALA